MRSSGIGWAGGSGRIGGIAFPYAGGLALTLLVPLETIMLIVAAPALLIAVLIFILGIVNRGQISAGEVEAPPESEGEAEPVPA